MRADKLGRKKWTKKSGRTKVDGKMSTDNVEKVDLKMWADKLGRKREDGKMLTDKMDGQR